MKIEPGKFYKFNGYRLRALCNDGFGIRNNILIDDSDGVIQRLSNEEAARSLTEWEDVPPPYDNWDKVPVWAMWQWCDVGGQWRFSETKPELGNYTWYSACLGIGRLPLICHPSNYTGTWESSLQERPKP